MSNTTDSEEYQQFETSEDTCVICLVTMTDTSTRSLECGHVFHTECLDYWEVNSNLCPCCRKDMKQPLVALRDTLKVLNEAVCTASKAALKLKTISNNSQVGHLPMAETAVKNIDEFQNNLAMIAPIIFPPHSLFGNQSNGRASGYDDPVVEVLRSVFRVQDPVVQQHHRLTSAMRNSHGWPYGNPSVNGGGTNGGPWGFF